jgi:hypothetical protein
MGRTKVQVKSEELKEAIKLAEANGPFNTRQELAIKVASSQWALDNNITTSVVITRIVEFNLDSLIKTKKGKRGRQVGGKLSEQHKAAMISGRGKKVVDQEWLKAMRETTPAPYLPLIDKIEHGSLKASIHLHCLECTNYNKGEIRNCNIISCSNFGRRPYK